MQPEMDMTFLGLRGENAAPLSIKKLSGFVTVKRTLWRDWDIYIYKNTYIYMNEYIIYLYIYMSFYIYIHIYI